MYLKVHIEDTACQAIKDAEEVKKEMFKCLDGNILIN